MRVGMLWFDDSQERDLVAKIDRAARHYEAKYGLRPTLCYVHPSVLLGRGIAVPGIDVKGTNMVLPHHFWLGRSEEDRHRPAA
jgi:hypothetical protein